MMGALGALVDPEGPWIRVVQLSKAELSTLTKAADLLEALRKIWEDDEDYLEELDTDLALAMYTIRELVEAQIKRNA